MKHTQKFSMKFLCFISLTILIAISGCNDATDGGESAGTANAPEVEDRPKISWVHPLPQGHSLKDIIYLNGQFIAIGDNGAVLRSADAIEWTASTANTAASFSALETNGQVLVAVGKRGTNTSIAYYSNDNGANWQAADIDETIGELRGVVWTGNNFVAAGSSNDAVLISTTGESWNKQTAASTRSHKLAFGNGAIVSGSLNNIKRSLDGGSTWSSTSSVFAAAEVSALYYDGTQFLAATTENFGGIKISSDGESWASDAADKQYVANIGTLFSDIIDVDNYYWLTARDGSIHRREKQNATWLEKLAGLDVALHSLVHANDTFVAVGESGAVRVSNDGNNWQTIGGPIVTTSRWAGIATNDAERMVALSEDGKVLYSDNGTDWTASELNDSPYMTAIAWSGTRFVATGTNVVANSIDGETWEVVDPRTGTGDAFFSHVAGIDEKWMALVGNNLADDQLAICSPAGCDMREAPSATRSLIAAENQFVIIRAAGTVMVSDDGLDWRTTERPINSSNSFYRIASIDDNIVVTPQSNAHQNTAFSSDGGETWISVDFPANANITASALFSDGNRFYLRDGSSAGQALWISEDGLSWSKQDLPYPVRGIATLSDKTYILGNQNHIFEIELP
ncbi:hypothetical protein NFC81_03755 [Salinispirillum sp. LH 10-3-1]|uniref:Photosynthesis system II assembly factor Ycf48/Hcf136-like domain-containing protein n=1 Tax=Salinispirillum sp. LH 10-3-1 TaxID=2952525 RepID=A0AB38YHY5_9GAMM